MVTKAQTQASRKWEKENPHRTGYAKLRRTAFSFVNPKPGSKAEEHINANHADYVEDLKELKYELDKKFEETKMTIEYNGIKLILDQDAYITGTHEDPYFEAHAHDEQGNEYMVTWYPKSDWDESEIDANDACDWDNPDDVTEL